MQVFTHRGVIVVSREYRSAQGAVGEWVFFNIFGDSTRVTQEDVVEFDAFIRGTEHFSYTQYEEACRRHYEKEHNRPLWKRLIIGCITKITRTIG